MCRVTRGVGGRFLSSYVYPRKPMKTSSRRRTRTRVYRSCVCVRACVREKREKSSRTRPSGRKNLKRAQQPSSRDRSTRKKQRGRRREPACSKSLGQIIFETRLHRASGCAADAELWIRHAQGAQREESRVLPEHVSAFHAPLTLASDSIARNLAV